MKSLTMKCPACRGDGTVPLPSVLRDTLIQLRMLGEATVRQVHARTHGVLVNQTAINNRLEDLRLLGFVDRRRCDGRSFVYFPVPAK